MIITELIVKYFHILMSFLTKDTNFKNANKGGARIMIGSRNIQISVLVTLGHD